MKTEVFHLSKITKKQLTLLKTALLSGTPCILPTDTVYGLVQYIVLNDTPTKTRPSKIIEHTKNPPQTMRK